MHFMFFLFCHISFTPNDRMIDADILLFLLAEADFNQIC